MARMRPGNFLHPNGPGRFFQATFTLALEEKRKYLGARYDDTLNVCLRVSTDPTSDYPPVKLSIYRELLPNPEELSLGMNERGLIAAALDEDDSICGWYSQVEISAQSELHLSRHSPKGSQPSRQIVLDDLEEDLPFRTLHVTGMASIAPQDEGQIIYRGSLHISPDHTFPLLNFRITWNKDFGVRFASDNLAYIPGMGGKPTRGIWALETSVESPD